MGKKLKYKIPLGKDEMVVFFTKDLLAYEDLVKLKEALDKIDFDNKKYMILPSEFIKDIKIIKRKRKNVGKR